MHLGFQRAGYTTVAAVEQDLNATTTMRQNFSNANVYQCDVKDFLERHQNQAARHALGRIDHIHSSSPCCGFSGANICGGANDKKNNDLSLCLIEAARIFMPTSLTFENVLGMWRRKNVHYLKTIVKELLRLGYQVRVVEVRSCDYGSPQIRPRIVLSATFRSAPRPQLPAKTHGDSDGLLPYVVPIDVLSCLEGSPGTHGTRLHHHRGRREERSDLERLDANRLAPTICASSKPLVHYKFNRYLAVSECGVVQGLPTTFKFYGSMRHQRIQVGNAVPVELSTAIALAAKKVLDFEYIDDDPTMDDELQDMERAS